MWTCDHHCPNGPECETDVVNEDTARDGGWVRIERYVDEPSALRDGKTWRRREVGHVCAGCITDPECHEWINREGWTGYYHEDVEALKAVGVNL